MKVKEYLKELNSIIDIFPEVLEMQVIHAHDDEGNWYQVTNNPPSICQVDDFDHYHLEEVNFETDKPNALCIN